MNLSKFASMLEIAIRRATVHEIVMLQSVSRKTFSETFSSVNTPENMSKYLTEALSTEKLLEEFNTTGSEFYFAESNKEVLGYLKVNTGTAQTEMKHTHSFEIERIYVLKNYQGLKLGQSLLKKAIDLAREKNLRTIWLGVWEENKNAIQFYLKNGFHQFDTHIFKLGEDEQVDLLMKLELQP